MMRWIVNENVSGTVIRTLRERGHDVLAVKESLRGAADLEILAQAQSGERVVVTHQGFRRVGVSFQAASRRRSRPVSALRRGPRKR
jgi:predicted nuclease of predicted toxin-antitoxin system